MIRTWYAKGGKRAFDVALASILLIVTAPIVLVAAVFVRLRLGRPILFRQERVGKDGRRFTVLKLRTMRRDRRHDDLPFDGLDRRSPMPCACDPRHTPLGRFLRRWSIDELPQLVNVLRGNMSLVGPRPELASAIHLYAPEQLERLRVRPGLTGVWQLRHRSSKTDMRVGSELDVAYARKPSLGTDLRVLLVTPIAVLRHGAPGVEACHHIIGPTRMSAPESV